MQRNKMAKLRITIRQNRVQGFLFGSLNCQLLLINK